METIADIGLYDYINLTFPHLSKSNKVLYYKLLIQRLEYLVLHVEWLNQFPDEISSPFMPKECIEHFGIYFFMNTRSSFPSLIQSYLDLHCNALLNTSAQGQTYMLDDYEIVVGDSDLPNLKKYSNRFQLQEYYK